MDQGILTDMIRLQQVLKIYSLGHVEVRATSPDQELDTRGSTLITYWEGSVAISGTANDRPVAGVGYLEMTGYAAPFRQPL